jgi:hypothetical protein
MIHVQCKPHILLFQIVMSIIATIFVLHAGIDHWGSSISSDMCPVDTDQCKAVVRPSRVECKPAEGVLSKYSFTQSCLYRNIYFIDGTPTLVFTPGHGKILQNTDTMRNRDDFHEHFRPTKLFMLSARSICENRCVMSIQGVSILSDFWLGNIGHALFDSFYAAFVGLIEYNNIQDRPFRIINVHPQKETGFVSETIHALAPLGMIYASDLFSSPGYTAFHISELLVPNYARCISCMGGSHYGMQKGYELDALRLYRNFVYGRLGMQPPSTRRVQVLGTLQAIAVNNKRFSGSDKKAIVAAFDDVSASVAGNWVDWRKMTFREQIQLLAKTHIHLSAPGTGMIYHPFMNDGSVHVNLGSCSLFHFQTGLGGVLMNFWYPGYTSPIPGYMEQSIAASTPYQRALYYPADQICAGLTRERVRAIINQAVRVYRSNFSIPIPRGENLAPEGRIVEELLRRDPVFSDHLSDPIAHKPCSTGEYFWPEIVVREAGGWRTGVCRLNHTLLEQIKYEQGYLVPLSDTTMKLAR